MNLNLGSGNHPCAAIMPGWVDVDVDTTWGTTVAATAEHLPFADGTFQRVYMGHMLEHLRWEDQLLEVLAEVRRVMTPGGTLMAVGPDIVKAIHTGQPQHLLDSIADHIPADSPGGHQWVATEGLTVRALERGGLINVVPVDVATVMRPEWPNPEQAPWQCAAVATCPPKKGR